MSGDTLSPILQQINHLDEDTKRVGDELVEHLQHDKFYDLLDSSSEAFAFIDCTQSRDALTHQRLSQFINDEFDLPGVAVGARVCVCLPNIPELGCCLVSLLATQRVVFPLNPAMTAAEMEWEISRTKCEAVVTLATQSPDTSSPILSAARALNLPVYTLHPNNETVGLFSTTLIPSSLAVVSFSEVDNNAPPSSSPASASPPSGIVTGAKRHSQLVLLLFTSGTSGKKKLVPYSLDMLVSGVSCIIASVMFWRVYIPFFNY